MTRGIRMNGATGWPRAVHGNVAPRRATGCRTIQQQKEDRMFETSMVRVQARAADRRLGLLTVSVGAHVAIIAGVVAAGLTSVRLPDRAPNQWTIPVVPAPPPALGTPDARPRPTHAQPQPRPQAQRVPV